MGRSSLQNVASLQDPAQSWNFDLFLPSIPGSSDTRDLTFKCMSTDLPGASLDVVKVDLHGVTLNFAGRATYTHTMQVIFLETADYSTRDKFIKWRESIRSWANNTGTLAATYKCNAQLVVYNDLPQVTRTCNVYGMWPETIADVPLNGAESNAVTLTITFSFDYFEDV